MRAAIEAAGLGTAVGSVIVEVGLVGNFAAGSLVEAAAGSFVEAVAAGSLVEVVVGSLVEAVAAGSLAVVSVVGSLVEVVAVGSLAGVAAERLVVGSFVAAADRQPVFVVAEVETVAAAVVFVAAVGIDSVPADH